jgi:hypothetical protein
MKVIRNTAIKVKTMTTIHPETIRGPSDSTMRNLPLMAIKNTEEEEGLRGPKIRKL